MTLTHTQAARPRQAGFTLIELMVSITVLSVLLGIGVPAFSDMIRNNRLTTQTNSLVGALNYARAEVASRGIPVSICAATDTSRVACGAAENWPNGWMIFTDRTGDPGVLDGTDEVLQTGQPVAGGFGIVASAAFVRFGIRSGDTAATTFEVRPTNAGACATSGTREIAIGATGRVSSKKGTCE